MSYGQSPIASHRRSSGRYDDYQRPPARNYPSEYDDYRRSRPAYDDRRAPRGRDYGPLGGYSRDSQYSRQGYSRAPYEESRRPSRYEGGHNDVAIKPSRVLGIFGLSTRTEERDLYDVLSEYGPIEDIQIVFDSLTGRSRGFAFAYFEHLEDARAARSALSRGLELHGKRVRIDYSFTSAPHNPTPGVYMGKDKRNFPGGRPRRPFERRYDRPVRSGYPRSRSRSPLSPRRRMTNTNGMRDGYNRRPHSRSRTPPQDYSPRRSRGRPGDGPPPPVGGRRRSASPGEDNARYTGPAKDDQRWSDEGSVSPPR